MKILKVYSDSTQGMSPAASPVEIEADLISRLSLDINGKVLETEVRVIGWLQELSLFLMARLPDFAWYRRSLMFGGSVFEAKQLPGGEAEIMVYDLAAGQRVPVRLDDQEIHDLIQALIVVVEEASQSIAEGLKKQTSNALEDWLRRRQSSK